MIHLKRFVPHIVILIFLLIYLAIGGWSQIMHNIPAVSGGFIFWFYKSYVSGLENSVSAKVLAKKRRKMVSLLFVVVWGLCFVLSIARYQFGGKALLISFAIAIVLIFIPVVLAEYLLVKEQNDKRL